MASSPGGLQKSFSTPSRRASVDERIDEEDDEDEVASINIVRRQLNDASDLVLDLPAFRTGDYFLGTLDCCKCLLLLMGRNIWKFFRRV